MKPQIVADDQIDSTQATSRPTRADLWRGGKPATAAQDPAENFPSPSEFFGVDKPLVVYVTPNYADEPPSNALFGELGSMQAIARVRDESGAQAIELARWVPSGPDDLEGQLVVIDPLAGGGQTPRGKLTPSQGRELHVRTDIDRVVAVVVRFPIAEERFTQIHTVFCTYGSPRLIADFSNAGLYMDMRMGQSMRERGDITAPKVSRPYSLKVLSQFDVVRVPTQRIADMLQRELKGAA